MNYKKKLIENYQKVIFNICSLMPLQDKVVGSSFYGKKFENNPKFIFEELNKEDSNLKLIWIANKKSKYELPDSVERVTSYTKQAYEYATAKVWIDSHQLPIYAKKRKNQLSIIMWHGGLGIKKIANDVAGRGKSEKVEHTAKNADIFVSNSDYRDQIIRSALMFDGKIWKCGFPKNDLMVNGDPTIYQKVRKDFGFDKDTKILLYAPTYRIDFSRIDYYDVDFDKVKNVLEETTKQKWKILVHWHPLQGDYVKPINEKYKDVIIDSTNYPSMQDLIVSCDAFLSDYSSGIFDAATRRIPCFVYANDYEEYKKVQGVYYEVSELPFPYSENNKQLINNIKNFDKEDYLKKWDKFSKKVGLVETGHSSKDIAQYIINYVRGK